MSGTRISSLLGKITVLVIICCFSLSAQAKYGGGTGEPNDPYLIYYANQMNAIDADVNDLDKCFKLMADIDLSGYTGTQFNIIGTNFFHPFTGVFDGNGHTISNFTCKSKEGNIGLFVFVSGENAEIKDLGLIDPNVYTGTERGFAGSLVGYLSRGTINNCYVEGGIVLGSGAVGGLVSTNELGTITNCYSTGSVAGTSTNVGGLVGFNWGGSITNCYSTGSVSGTGWYVGGLVGENWKGTITNCSATGSVEGKTNDVGGLVGKNLEATITNSYSTGNVQGKNSIGGLVGNNRDATITNCFATGSVSGTGLSVGGLVGYNLCTITDFRSQGDVSGDERSVGGPAGASNGTISDCYATGSVSGYRRVGGLVGMNAGTISNCYSTGTVSGNHRRVGGLVGTNWNIISNCYSTGDVAGDSAVGGLVGINGEMREQGTISNCYSTGDVAGNSAVGGLVGINGEMREQGTISNCYSTGSVTGKNNVGGLVGGNASGTISASFWDIQTSEQTTSAGGTGLSTNEMQTMSTFTDAGWDFTTPIWTIDEGLDYPRLWWELTPVLRAEPEVTLGTSNTISWDPLPGANDYYAECASDADFTKIIHTSGWITKTSYKFTGLQLGQRYWYRVKARNSAGTESQWSNVESSLQGTLADAVETLLNQQSMKKKNMKNSLLNKTNAVRTMIDVGRYEEALNKLQNDILQKTNGCADTGQPDNNDWIITCEQQCQIYPLIIETIEYVKSLME